MMENIRYWTCGLINCFPKHDNVVRGVPCRNSRFGPGAADPRELPRPSRYSDLEMQLFSLPAGHNSVQIQSKRCDCDNCVAISDILECLICTGELTPEVGVTACEYCANITCWSCATQLAICPFCRKYWIPFRNIALERVFAKFKAHCRLPLIICDKRVEKVHHCLMFKHCPWRGKLSGLALHLEDEHSVPVLVSKTMDFDIRGFSHKVDESVNDVRTYCVSLSCYSSLILCNIFLHDKRLRASFSGASSFDEREIVAYVEVESSYRSMKQILLISSDDEERKELNISCEGLISPWLGTDDKLLITVTIRALH